MSSRDAGFGPDRRARGGEGGRPHPYRREESGPDGFRGGRGRRRQRNGRGGGGGPAGGFQHGGGGFRGGPPPPGGYMPPFRVEKQVEEKIDRTKICPLFLRVYIQRGAHHSASSFAVRGEEPNEDSIVIYTWMDATLRELAELVQLVNDDARRPNTQISFAFIYPDRTGTNVVKHVQTIESFRDNQTPAAIAAQRARSQEDMKTLRQLKFETGDCLSIALLP